MIKTTTPFLFLLVLLATSAVYSQAHQPPLLNFDDLQKFDGVNTTFRIEGYIFDIYKCPPCPKGGDV